MIKISFYFSHASMFSNVCSAFHTPNYSQCAGTFLFKALINQCLSYMFSAGLLAFTSSQISHQYHFINIKKNWTEAQRFCRENYTDLATVNNADEMNSLFKTIANVSYDVYIGLYRSEEFRWHWSLPDSYSEETFQNWRDKQPDVNNNEGCAVMDNSGKWFNISCDSQRQFVCFDGKNFYCTFVCTLYL